MLRQLFVSIGLAVSLVEARPLAPTYPTTAPSPCAEVSKSAASYLSAHPFATASPTVSAKLAYDCLQSVPLHPEPAHRLVNALRPMLEFQSTVTYLKDPQCIDSNYYYAGTDLLGGLDSIQAEIASGAFKSEWEFEMALNNLVTSAHDGHLSFQGSALTMLPFVQSDPLVSFSKDGVETPEIYFYKDVLAFKKGQLKKLPSSICKINGQDASSFILHKTSISGTEHDPDANYNAEFYQLSAEARTGSVGKFYNTIVYPGENTTFQFSNGTHISSPNTAIVSRNFSGVNSGEAFYKAFCTPTPIKELFSGGSDTSKRSDQSDASQKLPPPAGQFHGYPVPIASDRSGIAQGFLPSHVKGLEDAGVLVLSSFEAGQGYEAEALTDIQMAIRKSLVEFQKAGKSKLVIDLQGNPGGIVDLGLDLFGQLFPHIKIFRAVNIRAHESANIIGKGLSSILASLNPIERQNLTILSLDSATDIWNLDLDYKPDGTKFKSWKEVYGPVEHRGDNFTNVVLSDVYTNKYSPIIDDLTVTGTFNRTHWTRPFAPEDVIMFTDGVCDSTCSVFMELMKREAGVKSIALGGRPLTGPMQAIGGTKGAQIFPYSRIYSYVSALAGVAPGEPLPQAFIDKYNDTALGPIANDMYYVMQRLDSGSATAAGVNGANQLRAGNLGDGSCDATPLQFVYEAADCRLYWTQEMLFNITAVWSAVADAAFKGGKLCVPGSTGHPSSLSGGDYGAPVFNSTFPPVKAQ